jgi:hypothetical protein
VPALSYPPAMALFLATIVSGLFGTVVISPATPVCIAGQPCTKPAAGTRLTFYRGAAAVTSVVTTSTGHYRVGLAPGVYTVRLATKSRMTRLAPTTVTVTRVFSHRNFTIDTGIR